MKIFDKQYKKMLHFQLFVKISILAFFRFIEEETKTKGDKWKKKIVCKK